MQKHESFAPVQETACRALGNMARACAAVDRLAVAANSRIKLQRITTAMAAHPANVRVLTQACYALAGFAQVDSVALPPEVMQPVVSALLAFAADPSVQVAGCEALACLLGAASNSTASVALVKAAVDAGAVEATVVALRSDAGNKLHLQTDGCRILAALSQVPANAGLIVGRGGVDVLSAALRNHVTTASVAAPACAALANLAASSSDHEILDTLLRGSCAERVLNAMGAHDGVERLQASGVRFLSYVARNGDSHCRRALVDAGCVARVRAAILRFSSNMEIHAHAADTLVALNQ
jgi:hypothetical protein